jgi:hypothetical protein
MWTHDRARTVVDAYVQVATDGAGEILDQSTLDKYRVTGTAHPIEHYLSEYEAQLPAFMLEMKPQLRTR